MGSFLESINLGAKAGAETGSKPQGRGTYDGTYDLAHFPRGSNYYRRQVGFPPWKRETLTWKEAREASFFKFGAINNPVSESPGEARIKAAVRINNLRLQVRRWLDENRTDAQIKHFIETGQGVDRLLYIASYLSPYGGIPQDIRERFGLELQRR